MRMVRWSVTTLTLAVSLLAVSSANLPQSYAQDGKFVTIKGQVVLALGQAIPERTKINVTVDQKHCLEKGPLLSEEFIVDKETRGVQNVFVWIGPDDKLGTPFDQNLIHPSLAKPKSPHVEIDQPCCAFIPRAVAARAGQGLLVKNSAPIVHNVNWASKANGQGNILMPAGGQNLIIPSLKADRLPINIACNVHGWMSAKVRVFDHPYFAVTDEKGNFEIKLVPQGKFRIWFWQESIGFVGGVAGRDGKVIELTGDLDLGKIEVTKD